MIYYGMMCYTLHFSTSPLRNHRNHRVDFLIFILHHLFFFQFDRRSGYFPLFLDQSFMVIDRLHPRSSDGCSCRLSPSAGFSLIESD